MVLLIVSETFIEVCLLIMLSTERIYKMYLVSLCQLVLKPVRGNSSVVYYLCLTDLVHFGFPLKRKYNIPGIKFCTHKHVVRTFRVDSLIFRGLQGYLLSLDLF